MAADDAILRIAGWLAEARRGVVFTGAGMSTESGIPDFRSPGGIWTRNRPIPFGEFVASQDSRHSPGKFVWRPGGCWIASQC